MISLVTQSDGSARRIPFISVGLAVSMALAFSSLREQTADAETQADSAMAEAIAYFETQPSVTVPDAMSRYISAARIKTLRDAEEETRDRDGLYATSASLLRRRQERFDALAADAVAALAKLPVNAFAVMPAPSHDGSDKSAGTTSWSNLSDNADDPAPIVRNQPIRNFDHVLHHASFAALGLSLIVLLLFGMALEDVWGSIVFGAFCAAVIPVGALVYTTFPPALAGPWLGGAGLSAALLGASLARWPQSGSPRFLGGIPLSPLLCTPVWLVADALIVRQLSLTTLDLLPLVTYGALLGVGVGLGVAVRKIGLEEKLTARWDDSNVPVKNPTYEMAMDLRTAGKREEAMELLVRSFSRKASVDLALGMWDVGKELGRPAEGAVGALHLIRDALRRKDTATATSYWSEVVDMVDVIDAEPGLFMKIAEMFAADGKDAEAARAIACSTHAPRLLPPALALRAATFVAAEDAGLASRVAARAIDSGTCSKKDIAALAKFVVAEPLPISDPDAAAGPPDEMLAEKRIPGGDPLVVKFRELKAFHGLRAKPTEDAAPSADIDDTENSLDALGPLHGLSIDDDDLYESLDPGALDLSDLGTDEDFVGLAEGQAGEVADLSEGLADESFGAVDLGELDTEAVRAELFAGDSEEPLAASIEDQVAAEAARTPIAPNNFSGELEAEESTDAFMPTDRPTVPMLEGQTAARVLLRSLRLIEAVPLDLEEMSIKLDADGTGKTRLPFARIEAVSVAGVRGLSDRPVVLIDLILNYRGDPSEALRVLRIRSDRFDPMTLVPAAANGVDAVKQLIVAIVAGSRAEMLPNEAAVRGAPFAIFESLASYHAEVLHVGELDA